MTGSALAAWCSRMCKVRHDSGSERLSRFDDGARYLRGEDAGAAAPKALTVALPVRHKTGQDSLGRGRLYSGQRASGRGSERAT